MLLPEFIFRPKEYRITWAYAALGPYIKLCRPTMCYTSVLPYTFVCNPSLLKCHPRITRTPSICIDYRPIMPMMWFGASPIIAQSLEFIMSTAPFEIAGPTLLLNLSLYCSCIGLSLSITPTNPPDISLTLIISSRAYCKVQFSGHVYKPCNARGGGRNLEARPQEWFWRVLS